MKQNFISVYSNSHKSNDFLQYVYQLIKGEPVAYSEKMDSFIICPYKFNISHILAYFNRSDLLKQSLENDVPFSMTRLKENPLSLSIKKDFSACITVILNNLSKRLKKNPYCIVRIQKNLIELNLRGDKGLENFYKSLICQDKSSYLQKFCSDNISLPIYKFQKSFETKPLKENSLNLKPVVYYHSVIKLSKTGSQQSLDFLRSLVNSPNPGIFESDFIDCYLSKK